MSSFNKVMLMGNLTRDPQMKQLQSNTVVAEFGIASTRKYRTSAGEDREETAFIDCAAFGRQAEVINQFCKKGKPIFIEGRLKYDTWDDKQSGAKRSKLSVVVENFQFIGGREREDGSEDRQPQRQSRGGGARPQKTPWREEQGDESGMDPSEIPF